jgi:hypothetical protein
VVQLQLLVVMGLSPQPGVSLEAIDERQRHERLANDHASDPLVVASLPAPSRDLASAAINALQRKIRLG